MFASKTKKIVVEAQHYQISAGLDKLYVFLLVQSCFCRVQVGSKISFRDQKAMSPAHFSFVSSLLMLLEIKKPVRL